MIATEFATAAEPPAISPSPRKFAAPRLPVASNTNLYGALFCAAFVLRFAFMLWRKTYAIPPSAIYETSSIADHLARGLGFSSPFIVDTGPTAWIAPIYPFFVSLVFRCFGIYSATSTAIVMTIQCLMAAATAITTYALGKRTVGQQPALLAAWVWAVSPFFFRWPTSWIWDMTFTALALSLVFIWTFDLVETGEKKIWNRLGILWGVIALTNPALLSLLPFTTGYAAVANIRAKRQWLRGCVTCAVLFLGIISPWLIRNWVVFKQPVFLRSNYWFEFHLGNYHYSNGVGFSGKHPTHNAFELAKYEALGELRYVQQARDDAFRFVREHPLEFLNLTWLRARWFWDGSFLILQSGEWWRPWEYWPLSALGLLGLLFAITRRPRGWLLFAMALLVYPIPYYLSFPTARYRHTLEPLLLLLAAYLVSVIWIELQVRNHRRHASVSS